MSVSTTATSQSFTSTGGTTYPITAFAFFDSTELLVVKKSGGVSTTLVLGTDYSVTGGAGSTGNVITTTAIPSGVTLIVSRVTSKTQLTSYTTGDRFPASAQEKALDRLTMIAQENAQNSIPNTTSTSGSAPFVLGISDAGASPTWVSQSSSGIADGSITASKLTTGHPTWDGSGNLSATSFVGPLTGAVTGNVTATTISASGTITGNVTGDLTGTASAIANGSVSTTAKIADGVVTAAKLGTNEKKQICKAWVNFNGVQIYTSAAALSGRSLSVTSGSNIGTWSGATGWTSAELGVIYYFNIGGTNATLGGVNVSTVGVQITNIVSSTVVQFTLLAGPATVSQIVNGNNGSSGFSVSSYGIRSSYNVSSVTKNGTGDYTVNLVAVAVTDAFYSVAIGGYMSGVSNPSYQLKSVQSTSSFGMISFNGAGSAQDPTILNAQVFGN